MEIVLFSHSFSSWIYYFLVHNSSTKIKTLSNDNSKLLERSGLLEKEKENQTTELKGEREKVIELNSSLASLNSDYSNLQQKLIRAES